MNLRLLECPTEAGSMPIDIPVEEHISGRSPLPSDPPAGLLKRFEKRPVLQPIPEHPWESRYVLNAASIRLNGKVYLLYRAVGEDEISRIGLAISEDGLCFSDRLDTPIFEPELESESRGCEDPRVTRMGDRIYMLYTAYNGELPQIALASLSVREFLTGRWKAWRRHGLVFPGWRNKDATVFPQVFNNKIGLIHRLEPHMWITFSSSLKCPWPSQCHAILASVSPGDRWDSMKIGAGAQPIKTRYGWLLVIHGVALDKTYRLGVMLLDLMNPSQLIYRSPNPILEPETSMEKGLNSACWVPNVVFTCGAVPRDGEKEILGDDDEIIIYYGAADTIINIATGSVGELIPLKVRRRVLSSVAE